MIRMIHVLCCFSKTTIQLISRKQCTPLLKRSITKNSENLIVLGIETSCDETGCGIVDSNGVVLGDALHSQQQMHSRYGGIIPPVAHNSHRNNITNLCEQALMSANIKLHDVDAIATTVEPGLPLSLSVGRDFGVRLSILGNKPLIPIHHMEAHALVVRMTRKVNFPYLVLLISGGHCLLAIVENSHKFYRLGTTIDDAPGEAFDKIARRLKLKNILEFSYLSGGQAIETAASRAKNPMQFRFPAPLSRYADCNFSFAGLKTAAMTFILEYEKKFNIIGDEIIPDTYNLCAGFQLAITKHLCQRTQRAMEFIEKNNIFPEQQRILVISGGVACNNFISNSLDIVCSEMGYTLLKPPPYLCTDNGLMIAWNGVERLIANSGIITKEDDIKKVDINKKSPLGTDWTSRVREDNIKCKWIKVNKI